MFTQGKEKRAENVFDKQDETIEKWVGYLYDLHNSSRASKIILNLETVPMISYTLLKMPFFVF